VKVLSGGERSRLAMIRLLLEPVNLLILDEPTNHLDMPSKDVLKDAIKSFDGTVIVVSHDREFLDGLVTKVYEFGNKKVQEHLGGIYDFLQHRKMDSLQELEISISLKSPSIQTNKGISENKLSYEVRKEQNKKIRKAEKAIEENEQKVAKLEKEIAEMDKQLELPGKASDIQYIQMYQREQRELEQKIYEWELLCGELENIKAEIPE